MPTEREASTQEGTLICSPTVSLLDLSIATAWVIALSKSKKQLQWQISAFQLLAVTVLACHLCYIPLDSGDEARHLPHMGRYWSRNMTL